jgi:hypothetical protein
VAEQEAGEAANQAAAAAAAAADADGAAPAAPGNTAALAAGHRVRNTTLQGGPIE